MKRTKSEKAVDFIIAAILLLLCFTMLYPFWNAVIIAFNDGRDTIAGGLTFWPRKFTIDNIKYVIQDSRIVNAFGISAARTVAGTFVSVFITSILAFGLSRPELKFRKFYMALLVFTMYFGGGMIPSYILIRDLGLRNTFWVYIIPGAVSVWNMIIFRSFFTGLPAGLLEAAKIDGANWFVIYFKIVFQVSMPVFATLSLFTAVSQWNSWFDAALYVSNPKLMPIQNILNTIMNTSSMKELLSKLSGAAATALKNSSVTSRAVTMATMVVATTPILLVYPFVQRFFVSGVMIGSLKE